MSFVLHVAVAAVGFIVNCYRLAPFRVNRYTLIYSDIFSTGINMSIFIIGLSALNLFQPVKS